MSNTLYFDASAIVSIMKREKCALKLIDYLDASYKNRDIWVSSILLKAEILRSILRYKISNIMAIAGNSTLYDIHFIPFNEDIYDILFDFKDRKLGTLDAFHLATAIHCNIKNMITYDGELANSCKKYNINVISPRD